jgi:hypothetical protein
MDVNEEAKNQKIVSFFEKKFSLFREYQSLTGKMKKAFGGGQKKRFLDLLLERRSCMNKIDKTDVTLKKWSRDNHFQLSRASGTVKGFLDDYLCKLREMMESIHMMDREMLECARVEARTLQSEILQMKRAKTMASGYRRQPVNSPRFLDTKR